MSSQAPSNLKQIVGANIRSARKRKALTQTQLAGLLGVPDMYVSKWERGLHRPNDSTLFALAEALDCDFVALFTEPEERAA